MPRKIEAPKEPTGPRHIRPAESAAVEETPDLGGSKRGQELPPAGPPSPPFYLATHPNRWCVMGGQVVPLARQMMLRPGSGGIDADGAGRPKPSTAIAEAEEQGWTVIPWDVLGRGTSYLRRVQSTGGWITRWTTLHPGAEDISVDEEGYAAFWRNLIDTGRLDGPAPWVLEKVASAIRKSLEAETRKGAKTRRAAELEERLAVVDAERARAVHGPASAAEAVPDVG
jgi:hypothetical protein